MEQTGTEAQEMSVRNRTHQIQKDTAPEPPQQDGVTKRRFSNFWNSLTPKWKNWWLRVLFAFTMIFVFILMILIGPYGISFLIYIIQLKAIQEVVSISYQKYIQQNLPQNLPLFRSLNWYFVLVVSYFSYGISLQHIFEEFDDRSRIYKVFKSYHMFISFLLYMAGFIVFVLTLKKGFYKIQFKLYGWAHLAILLFMTVGHFIFQSIFKNLYWFILPVSIVICNDIFAYIFGFFFGRTPLISVSPKKTWEGFIGGMLATLLFGFLFASYLAQLPMMVCPISSQVSSFPYTLNCTPSDLFQPVFYDLSSYLPYKGVYLYPCQLHAVIFSIFGSLIAPFGGFFASGFKRAFKLKDFDDLIPGHGGVIDRFDCQFLMASFVYVYILTFLPQTDLEKLTRILFNLPIDEQLIIHNKLTSHLSSLGQL